MTYIRHDSKMLNMYIDQQLTFKILKQLNIICVFLPFLAQKLSSRFPMKTTHFLTTGSVSMTTGSVLMKLIDFPRKSQKT